MNIRLPEDLYMELKMKAARERKSIAALIREKLAIKEKMDETKKKELLRRMKRLGKRIAKQNPGLNLTQGLINMRYEQ